MKNALLSITQKLKWTSYLLGLFDWNILAMLPWHILAHFSRSFLGNFNWHFMAISFGNFSAMLLADFLWHFMADFFWHLETVLFGHFFGHLMWHLMAFVHRLLMALVIFMVAIANFMTTFFVMSITFLAVFGFIHCFITMFTLKIKEWLMFEENCKRSEVKVTFGSLKIQKSKAWWYRFLEVVKMNKI